MRGSSVEWDDYDEFFLGGNITEPVAIEIPIKLYDVYELKGFLESCGLNITEDLDGIYISTRPDRFGKNSIITPALKPEDIKPFYTALKKLLSIKNVSLGYPHIIDLKYLVGYKRQNQSQSDGHFIEELLSQAEKSKDTLRLDLSEKRYLSWERDRLIDFFPPNALLNGSAISDPYSVITGDNSRFFRYASSDISYAVHFSGVGAWGAKDDPNGFQNISPSGYRTIGFVFQYKENIGTQVFFQNAGIEGECGNIPRGGEAYGGDETMVNRFKNPCIGEYVVWASIHNPGIIYIHKIPENDDRWQQLKEYYQPHNFKFGDFGQQVKYHKIEKWIAEGSEHTPYLPTNGLSIQEFEKLANDKLELENQFKQQLKDIEQKLVDLGHQHYQLFNKVDNLYISDFTSDSKLHSLSIQELYNYIQETKKKKKSICSVLVQQNLPNIHKQLQELQVQLEYIYKTSNNVYIKKESLKLQKQAQAINDNNDIKTKAQCYYELLDQQKSTAEDYIENKINSIINKSTDISDEEYICLPFEEREKIFQCIYKFFTGKKLKNTLTSYVKIVIKLYAFAPEQDKSELFNYLYSIRLSLPKDFLKEFANPISDIFISDQDQ
ncbi:MAG: hypothetical protein MJ158_03775, partial [Alphaproteobacteria bacterium]|nr:hypothetical protein [Alphaproteobacteria bacterium]